ncbi:hypothetical protein DBR43_05320 [Pedobacter sp. KBW06]|uniref:hypothetical protein n=1 Tax=Pedobacter sp. KBW06 TaxID=2153359 RepID=UPI000F59470B|nr:hypothetical protein [Pedobacter sp. KBW06]RQO74804.1 hypothetical protein DBR43_05320 [Pedobacter sp. KBW06]
MDETDKHKLENLRQQLPIGLRYGLNLLEKAGGNVEEAAGYFRQECRDLIVQKTGISEQEASVHLLKYNFDIAATLKYIDEARFSLTELIIRRNKDKEEALEKIAGAVVEKEGLIREYWLHPDALSRLQPEVFCLVMLMEWLGFAGWEDFETALYFHLDVISDLIDRQLLLPEIAETLKEAQAIAIVQAPQQKVSLERDGFVGQTAELTAQSDLFEIQRPLLIDTLYQFVKSNISKFPF